MSTPCVHPAPLQGTESLGLGEIPQIPSPTPPPCPLTTALSATILEHLPDGDPTTPWPNASPVLQRTNAS